MLKIDLYLSSLCLTHLHMYNIWKDLDAITFNTYIVAFPLTLWSKATSAFFSISLIIRKQDILNKIFMNIFRVLANTIFDFIHFVENDIEKKVWSITFILGLPYSHKMGAVYARANL